MKANFWSIALICACTCIFSTNNTQAQNILDMQSWTVGSGSAGAFNANGQPIENTRIWGEGPQGKRAILWEAKPEGQSNADGGFDHSAFTIDHTKMYRFSIWLKKTNSNDGYSYFGTDNVNDLNGEQHINPYFWYGDLPELNKWFLVVGYIHGSGDASTMSYGGIYDGLNGSKVADIVDFKFAVGATATNVRSYLYYDPNVNDRQYFYAPRVEVVNGNEPTIASLLGLQSVIATQGYFSGNVGIKTQTPRDYELAVNGKIRAREIKVEANNWPDYVFEEGYKVETLQKLESYIKANKHLPDMPSAKEVETNGIAVSEMLKLQQQKIEELTLYLIEKDKQVDALIKRVTALEDTKPKTDKPKP
ncbi:hypothetical protein [Pedobacter kyungheensis]|uniref:hypothetical protein n=1 Tax=Pedobacter kyungheensis TaxID=1069985 RepID=UPI000690594C|nr:hypothetical protein [Pedobacter kyungheensis]